MYGYQYIYLSILYAADFKTLCHEMLVLTLHTIMHTTPQFAHAILGIVSLKSGSLDVFLAQYFSPLQEWEHQHKMKFEQW